MSIGRLIIAVPSKGRIEEETRNLFGTVGLAILRDSGARDYKGRLESVPDTEVVFLSSAEIPGALENGTAHLGITGLDLINDRAANPKATIDILLGLGFGRADVVVAIPRAWIDVSTMADLAEVAAAFRARHHRTMRVATKYVKLTHEFFSNSGIVDYRIVESAGATEAAPASGLTDMIVDIATTRATLSANNLKVIRDGIILKSEAKLAGSLTALWTEPARAALRHVVEPLESVRSERRIMLSFAYSGDLPKLSKRLMEAVGQSIEIRKGNNDERMIECAVNEVHPLTDVLRATGVAGPITPMRVQTHSPHGTTDRFLQKLAAMR
jgi:ATP phosphoribosyltransferase